MSLKSPAKAGVIGGVPQGVGGLGEGITLFPANIFWVLLGGAIADEMLEEVEVRS
jgi:hypothetical protein